MDLTKREYSMHDHNTLLKEFVFSNEGKLKKLQDDAKVAQVSVCAPAPRGRGRGTEPRSRLRPCPDWGKLPCLLRVDTLWNRARRDRIVLHLYLELALPCSLSSSNLRSSPFFLEAHPPSLPFLGSLHHEVQLTSTNACQACARQSGVRRVGFLGDLTLKSFTTLGVNLHT